MKISHIEHLVLHDRRHRYEHPEGSAACPYPPNAEGFVESTAGGKIVDISELPKSIGSQKLGISAKLIKDADRHLSLQRRYTSGCDATNTRHTIPNIYAVGLTLYNRTHQLDYSGIPVANIRNGPETTNHNRHGSESCCTSRHTDVLCSLIAMSGV